VITRSLFPGEKPGRW